MAEIFGISFADGGGIAGAPRPDDSPGDMGSDGCPNGRGVRMRMPGAVAERAPRPVARRAARRG